MLDPNKRLIADRAVTASVRRCVARLGGAIADVRSGREQEPLVKVRPRALRLDRSFRARISAIIAARYWTIKQRRGGVPAFHCGPTANPFLGAVQYSGNLWHGPPGVDQPLELLKLDLAPRVTSVCVHDATASVLETM